MRISFVIPAYNEENYIGDCLDSILNETRGSPYDTEIIVVDNASTDRTAEIARKYSEVTVVDEKEKGLVRARRAGYLASTGDLIANIDSDTRLIPGWLGKVMAAFEKDPKLVALSGPFIYYDAPWSVRAITRFFYYWGYFFYLVNRYIFRVGSMVQGGNFVLRRTALETIGGYDTSLNFYGEDSDIARRINRVGKVKFTFKLPVYSSGRRLAKEGTLTIGLRYMMNYFWIMFFKRPFTEDSKDFRLTNKSGVIHGYESGNKAKEMAIAAGAVIIFLGIVGTLAFAAYRLTETGTVGVANFVRLGLTAKEEAQDLQITAKTLSSSTKSMIQEKWNEIGQ